MRLTPRLAVGITLLALIAAGCGGGANASVREVPGGPVELEVPGTAEGFAPAASATATATATETPAAGAEATPTPDAGTGDATTGADGTAEGGTEAPAAEAPAPTDEAPPPGAPNEQFEDYCAQNPGAC